jgi:hypothetical protein
MLPTMAEAVALTLSAANLPPMIGRLLLLVNYVHAAAGLLYLVLHAC